MSTARRGPVAGLVELLPPRVQSFTAQSAIYPRRPPELEPCAEPASRCARSGGRRRARRKQWLAHEPPGDTPHSRDHEGRERGTDRPALRGTSENLQGAALLRGPSTDRGEVVVLRGFLHTMQARGHAGLMA